MYLQKSVAIGYVRNGRGCRTRSPPAADRFGRAVLSSTHLSNLNTHRRIRHGA
jgi:hypothetical protein